MVQHLPCPTCRKLLYFSAFAESEIDSLEILCPTCKHKYQLLYSEVLHFNSTLESLQTPNAKQQRTKPNRVYNLRLLSSTQQVDDLQFSTPGQAEQFQTLPGDSLVLFCTMQGTKLGDLVLVLNCTTGTSCQLFSPINRAWSSGLTLTLIIFGLGTALATTLQGIPAKALLATSIPTAVGAGLYATNRARPRELSSHIVTKLSSEQNLLAQIHSFEHRIKELNQELASNRLTIDQFRKLRQKMQSTEAVNGSRVQSVSKAISILEQQTGLTQDLISEYGKVLNLVQVGFDAFRLTEHLPENIDTRILRQMEELRALEEKHGELGALAHPE